MIRLKQEHIDEISRHAETDYPYECCGILLGKFEADNNKTVEHILLIANGREEKDKHNRFLITPDEIMHGEIFARKNKMDVLGFYHSHPDHPALPSDYDLERAWPIYSYIIVSVAKSKAEDFTSWELETNRAKFNSELIIKGE
jgi:proteasome lid subunit RPN8/RPN11